MIMLHCILKQGCFIHTEYKYNFALQMQYNFVSPYEGWWAVEGGRGGRGEGGGGGGKGIYLVDRNKGW
jgi:hypothetical protein